MTTEAQAKGQCFCPFDRMACGGSSCMLWRWIDRSSADVLAAERHGYCGMAPAPESEQALAAKPVKSAFVPLAVRR